MLTRDDYAAGVVVRGGVEGFGEVTVTLAGEHAFQGEGLDMLGYYVEGPGRLEA